MNWQDDDLADFDARRLSFGDRQKTVYVSGSGPAVIVMAEMPGVGPQVIRFARWVRDVGLTVYLPSLFGRDGAVPDADEAATIFRAACISAEFRALGGGQSSPVSDWLKALARHAHAECGGPGVGAIGMCFTGNFAVTLLLEPAVIAAVVAQPALPLDDPAGIEASPQELAVVRERYRSRSHRHPRLSFCRRPFLPCRALCRLCRGTGPAFQAARPARTTARTRSCPRSPPASCPRRTASLRRT